MKLKIQSTFKGKNKQAAEIRKLKVEGKNYIFLAPEKLFSPCLWCGELIAITQKRITNPKFCISEHCSLYQREENKIKLLYPWEKDRKLREAELEKFYRLGINYKIPDREVK